MNKVLKRLYYFIIGIKEIFTNIFGISKLIKNNSLSQSYFGTSKKSKTKIYLENLMWLLKYKEINEYFYAYGFDIKSKDEKNKYFAYSEFREKRDVLNYTKPFNYICLLRDKFVFSEYLKGIGIPTPKNYALCNYNTIYWIDSDTTEKVENLINRNIDVFCKDICGECGIGVFRLTIENGHVFINGEERSSNELIMCLRGRFIFQEPVVQHSKLQQLYSNSLNTLRITTINDQGSIQVVCPFIRLGAGRSIIDNWMAGGIIIGIDEETGLLKEQGFYKPGVGTRTEYHPDTRILFKDYEIPYFKEAIYMVKRLHKNLYGIHSIGWDVAITEKGPIIIEGNDNWAIHAHQVIGGGLKRIFQ